MRKLQNAPSLSLRACRLKAAERRSGSQTLNRIWKGTLSRQDCKIISAELVPILAGIAECSLPKYRPIAAAFLAPQPAVQGNRLLTREEVRNLLPEPVLFQRRPKVLLWKRSIVVEPTGDVNKREKVRVVPYVSMFMNRTTSVGTIFTTLVVDHVQAVPKGAPFMLCLLMQ